jgi:hypothetical protein
MADEKKQPVSNSTTEEKPVEGIDFYFENGLFVLTEHFLRKRGYCCENGCRHCPYGFKDIKNSPINP